MKNIVLVGFMGTGKSVVGRRLAKEFSFRFVDTDTIIEEKAGKKVADIFAEEGEGRFRELEADVVLDIMRGEQLVVSTGGGAVLNQKSLDILCKNGIVVWLTARPGVILKRAQRRFEERPLLKGAVPSEGNNPLLTIERLMKEREPYYKRAAFSVDTSDTGVEGVVSKIKGVIFGDGFKDQP